MSSAQPWRNVTVPPAQASRLAQTAPGKSGDHEVVCGPCTVAWQTIETMGSPVVSSRAATRVRISSGTPTRVLRCALMPRTSISPVTRRASRRSDQARSAARAQASATKSGTTDPWAVARSAGPLWVCGDDDVLRQHGGGAGDGLPQRLREGLGRIELVEDDEDHGDVAVVEDRDPGHQVGRGPCRLAEPRGIPRHRAGWWGDHRSRATDPRRADARPTGASCLAGRRLRSHGGPRRPR